MRAVSQVMLINGTDPMIISIFYDLIDLERKMLIMRKTNEKIIVDEKFLRLETNDRYLRQQLWQLGLVVLKQRKAAKAWHLRFELIKRMSAVHSFVYAGKRLN